MLRLAVTTQYWDVADAWTDTQTNLL